MILIDSCVWIAKTRKNDVFHEKAKKLMESILSSGKKIFVTDLVAVEVINFLFKRDGKKVAAQAMNMFLESERIVLLSNSSASLKSTKNLFERHLRLSFTDANAVVKMLEAGITEIASFDEGFDEVKEIKRIH